MSLERWTATFACLARKVPLEVALLERVGVVTVGVVLLVEGKRGKWIYPQSTLTPSTLTGYPSLLFKISRYLNMKPTCQT